MGEAEGGNRRCYVKGFTLRGILKAERDGGRGQDACGEGKAREAGSGEGTGRNGEGEAMHDAAYERGTCSACESIES